MMDIETNFPVLDFSPSSFDGSIGVNHWKTRVGRPGRNVQHGHLEMSNSSDELPRMPDRLLRRVAMPKLNHLGCPGCQQAQCQSSQKAQVARSLSIGLREQGGRTIMGQMGDRRSARLRGTTLLRCIKRWCTHLQTHASFIHLPADTLNLDGNLVMGGPKGWLYVLMELGDSFSARLMTVLWPRS